MIHETHTICNKRLKQKGEKNCCWCDKHSHCEFEDLFDEKVCGRMIHAGAGTSCAEKVPCKYHSCSCFGDVDKKQRDYFCAIHGVPPNATRHGEDGRVKRNKFPEGKCCDNCYSNYTSDDIPREFYDACVNLTCKCHATNTPGDMECGYDCHNQAPYGFVPESGCPIHDVPIKDKKGIDYTKNNIYDGIGRSDLKPKEMAVEPSNWEKEWENLVNRYRGIRTIRSGEARDILLKFDAESLDFIRQTIQLESDKAYRRGQRDMEFNIGFLRQWLNEDRITDPDKMVTNKQIEKMLNIPPNI